MEAGAPEPEVRPYDLLDSFHPFVTEQIAISRSWPLPGSIYARSFYRPGVQITLSPPCFFTCSPPRSLSPALLHAVRAMSLNGLDNPAVVEAYQSALADAGGW